MKNSFNVEWLAHKSFYLMYAALLIEAGILLAFGLYILFFT